MSIKKRNQYFLLIIILLSLLCVPPIISCPDGKICDSGGNVVGESAEMEWGDGLSTAIDKKISGVGKGANTHFISEQTGASADGLTEVENGNLNTQTLKTDDGASATKVEGFRGGEEPNSFYINKAEQFSYNGLTATNVENIYGSPSEITLGRAENIEYKGVEIEDAIILYADDSVLSVANADLVEGHDVIAENVLTTTIKFDNEILRKIDLISKKDNNTIKIDKANVILDSGKEVEAIFQPDGTITITTEDPAQIDADMETVITLTERIDPGRNITGDANKSTIIRAVGNNIVEIHPVFGVAAVHLAPTGRYINYETGENAQPFSIFSLPGFAFDFYLKKHPDQTIKANMTNCVNCGLYDMHESTIQLNGVFEYERLDENNNFVDIIQSKTEDNRIMLYMDSNMDMIKSLTYSGTLAHFYSGPFEIRYANGMYSYRFLAKEEAVRPDVISMIEPDKTITQQTLARVIMQKNSVFQMYAFNTPKAIQKEQELIEWFRN